MDPATTGYVSRDGAGVGPRKELEHDLHEIEEEIQRLQLWQRQEDEEELQELLMEYRDLQEELERLRLNAERWDEKTQADNEEWDHHREAEERLREAFAELCGPTAPSPVTPSVAPAPPSPAPPTAEFPGFVPEQEEGTVLNFRDVAEGTGGERCGGKPASPSRTPQVPPVSQPHEVPSFPFPRADSSAKDTSPRTPAHGHLSVATAAMNSDRSYSDCSTGEPRSPHSPTSGSGTFKGQSLAARRRAQEHKKQFSKEVLMEDYLRTAASGAGVTVERYRDFAQLESLMKEEKLLKQQLELTENNLLLHTLQRIRDEQYELVVKLGLRDYKGRPLGFPAAYSPARTDPFLSLGAGPGVDAAGAE
eukprot:RCo011357